MRKATFDAYQRWRRLADAGYGKRCDTPAQMARVEARIRKAKAKYEDLLKVDAMAKSPDPVIERVNKIALECDDAILGLYQTVGLVSPEARRQWQKDNRFEGEENETK